jgi:hypothetical protein
MKNIFVSICFVVLSVGAVAQADKIDTIAVMILDRMSDVIGDLNSVKFTLSSSYDEPDHDFGTVRYTGVSEVCMTGPDKMLIHQKGDKGHRGFWYNSKTVTYYSFDENNYAVVNAPGDIISTIDTINKAYGIDFPAADFFYPTFTDDILEQFGTLAYLGKKSVEGNECFHILAMNDSISVQFWIANDAYNLPVKFLIGYKSNGNIQYEATFSDWQINPVIPVSAYEFLPPPKAARIILLPKSSN